MGVSWPYNPLGHVCLAVLQVITFDSWLEQISHGSFRDVSTLPGGVRSGIPQQVEDVSPASLKTIRTALPRQRRM